MPVLDATLASLTASDLLWLIPALPLAGAALLGLLALATAGSRRGANAGLAATVALAMPALAFAVVIAATLRLAELPQRSLVLGAQLPVARAAGLHQPLWEWFELGGVPISFGLHFDALTAVMLLVVMGIGGLIVLYSVGYMALDRGRVRFLAYLNLFLASMAVLLLGDNLLVTFLGWEGVGLCSYLLIGFWHRDHRNNDAARKAFIVNRIGDLGFLLGALLLLVHSQGAAGLNHVALGDWALLQGGGGPVLIAATLLLFLGCAGKSAQIPLQVWLPDAMAGPTPVSALIHAATMVTAGVFLLARLADVFVLAPLTMDVIAWVAVATALWGAIAALGQWDIKKVLAYSTVSQLGFMFLAAAVGAFDVAIFHVVTHAFFKATLFLGAGSVIQALHHEQDLRRMGGLSRSLLLTHPAMWFAWFAIIGLPLGSGFFSKDLILERVFAHPGSGALLYALGLLAAALTAFYMTRMMCYAFWSPARGDEEPRPAVREPGPAMGAPVFLLSLGALGIGLIWLPVPGGNLFERWLAPVVDRAQRVFADGQGVGIEPAGLGHWLIMALVSSAVAAIAAFAAYRLFRRGPPARPLAPASWAQGWTLGFDRLYQTLLIRPLGLLATVLDQRIDRSLLAPAMAGLGRLVLRLGEGYRSFQRGPLRISLVVSVAGVVLVLLALLRDILVVAPAT